MNDENNLDDLINVQIFTGEKCYFSLTLKEHFPIFASWWNEPGMAIYLQKQLKQRPIDDLVAMFEAGCHNDHSSAFGYSIFNMDNQLIGYVSMIGLEPPVNIASFGLMIGPEYRGDGYGLDALKVAMNLAFNEYGANKIEISAYAFNAPAIRISTKLGFKTEGIRRQALFHGGKFFDEIFMGLTLSEYRKQV